MSHCTLHLNGLYVCAAYNVLATLSVEFLVTCAVGYMCAFFLCGE